MTRLDNELIDIVVVVVEPTPRSMGVAQRAIELARERAHGRVIIVGNRVMDVADEQRLRAYFPNVEMIVVPLDPAVSDADRLGLSPFDTAPAGPAVQALAALADLVAAG